jgi:hypothetical protein
MNRKSLIVLLLAGIATSSLLAGCNTDPGIPGGPNEQSAPITAQHTVNGLTEP